ncbi:MAG: protein-disulfide reductase DsbD domain-containing protein [Phycisphaerales bacterium]
MRLKHQHGQRYVFGAVVLAVAAGAERAAVAEPPGSAPAVETPITTPSPAAPAKVKPQHARASAVVSAKSVKPGDEFWVGVVFDIDKDWHIYWPGQNDTGTATVVRVKAPAGYVVGEVQWPVPHRHVSPGDLLDHVYEKSATILIPIKSPAEGAPAASGPLAIELEWLVCKDACIAGDAILSVALPPAGLTTTPGPGAVAIEAAKKKMPERAVVGTGSAGAGLKTRWEGSTLTFEVAGATELTFMPGEASAVAEDLLESGTAKAGSLSVDFKPAAETPRVEGILEVKAKGVATRWLRVNLPVPKDKGGG